jgi:hypothetical protein
MCGWFKKRGYDDGHYQGYHNGYNPYNIINKVGIENQTLLCEDYKYSYNNGFDNGYKEGYKLGLDKWYMEYNQNNQYNQNNKYKYNKYNKKVKVQNNNITIPDTMPVMESIIIEAPYPIIEPETTYVEDPYPIIEPTQKRPCY